MLCSYTIYRITSNSWPSYFYNNKLFAMFVNGPISSLKQPYCVCHCLFILLLLLCTTFCTCYNACSHSHRHKQTYHDDSNRHLHIICANSCSCSEIIIITYVKAHAFITHAHTLSVCRCIPRMY